MQQNKTLIKDICFHNDEPIKFILGPCQIESTQHAFDMAGSIKEICDRLGYQFVYKSSYDKANRTSINGKRGLGLDVSLDIFDGLRNLLKVPVITDVHTVEQIHRVVGHVDALQIPAFLCRQTDLIVAAAQTNLPLNIKKGQFLSPQDTRHIIHKAESGTIPEQEFGFTNVMICERGTTFGYNTLVNDMTGLKIMRDYASPVIFDATHSVQRPGAGNGCSLGNRDMVPYLASAAVGTGCLAGVFIETHEDPDNAPSDGANMIRLSELEGLLYRLMTIDSVAKRFK